MSARVLGAPRKPLQSREHLRSNDSAHRHVATLRDGQPEAPIVFLAKGNTIP